MGFTAFRDKDGYRMIECSRCGAVVPQVYGLESNWTYRHNRDIRLPFGRRIPLKCKD